MITEERFRIILDELKAKKIITIQECAEITGTSESTARRDIITLDEMGKHTVEAVARTEVNRVYYPDKVLIIHRKLG